MPHKTGDAAQDCYRRIPLPVIHPPTVVPSFGTPNGTTSLVVTFAQAMIISAAPGWVFTTGLSGPSPVVVGWSTVNLQTYVLTLSVPVSGVILVTVPPNDLTVQGAAGQVLTPGTYVAGTPPPPVAACGCSNIPASLKINFSGGAGGSAGILNVSPTITWQGTGSLCGQGIEAVLTCNGATNNWFLGITPLAFPNTCFGGAFGPANCTQLVFEIPLLGSNCTCTTCTATIDL
jgi:hypothetical protein